jgi:hypothetical protein
MQPNQSFFQKYKKEIIVVVLALLVFIGLIYFLFFRNTQTTDTSSPNLQNKSDFTFSSLFGLTNNKTKDKLNPNSGSDEQNTEDQIFYYNEGLIKIWDKPVAGYGFYYKNIPYSYVDDDGKTQSGTSLKTILMFVDSNTGFVYEKDLSSPTSTPTQITDTSYPNIRKAYFINNKSGGKGRVIMQYLKNNTIKTISANVPDFAGISISLQDVTSLPDNINFINTSSNNENLIYVINKNKTTNNKPDVYSDWYLINNVNDTYGTRIYTSELTDWKVNITNSDKIYAYNKDSAYELSGLYKLNNSSVLGDLNQIYNNHSGVSFLINDSTALISMTTGDGLKTYLNNNFNGSNFSDSNISSLDFTTLSNKCGENDSSENIIICSVPKEIKNYDSGLPDAWYQGFTSWDDNLYVVNNDYPNGALLFNINVDGSVFENIDARDLKINNNYSHVLFINKNDGALWSLNIENILYQGD